MNQDGVGGRSLEGAKALALTDLLERVVLLERHVFGDGVEAGESAAEPVSEGGEVVFVPKDIGLCSDLRLPDFFFLGALLFFFFIFCSPIFF